MPKFLVAVVLVMLAAVPGTARAGQRATDPDLWATVNFCDTVKHPDAIGIRASMPGVPRGAKLQMRFDVQYRAGSEWDDVAGADSGWRMVGTAKGIPVEAGWSFTFAHPAEPVLLRGLVRFRWRRGNALPRQAQLPTEAGHRSSAGADPPDYTAATCSVGGA